MELCRVPSRDPINISYFVFITKLEIFGAFLGNLPCRGLPLLLDV